jgi:hypothetical protein
MIASSSTSNTSSAPVCHVSHYDDASADREQLHVENERRTTGDHAACSAVAVPKSRRDGQGTLLAHTHPCRNVILVPSTFPSSSLVSRACLGKCSGFSITWHRKNRRLFKTFPHQAGPCPSRQSHGRRRAGNRKAGCDRGCCQTSIRRKPACRCSASRAGRRPS